MAKVRMKANKLENASVKFISLVDRGANRIPFRIIKFDKESSMLDLGSMFRRTSVSKQEDVSSVDPNTPVLVGLVVEKVDDMTSTEEILKDHGFSTENVVDIEDGTRVYKQADHDFHSASIFRINDHLLALVSKFDATVISKSVSDLISKSEFVPDVQYLAAKAIEESLAPTIPAAVFDVAKALKDMSAMHGKSDEMEEKGDSHMGKGKKKKTDEDEEEEMVILAPKSEKHDAPAESNSDGSRSQEQVTSAPDMSELIQKAVADSLDPIRQMIEKANGTFSTLADKVNDLSEQVSGIKEQGETLTTKMTEVEKVAKAAADKVKGTVVGAMPNDDRPTKTVVSKADGDPRSGLFDTAFLPRRNQVSKFQRR